MRRRLQALLFTSLLLIFFGAASSASAFAQEPAPLSLDEYWTLVADSQRQLTALNPLEADSVRAALDSLAARWQAVQAVQLEDGQVVALDNRRILALLGAENPDLKSLGAYFETLLDARAEFSSAAFGVEELNPLQAVLLRPEFQWPEAQATTSAEPGWFQKLWDRFWRWMDRVFGVILVGLDWFPFFATLLLIAILAVVFREFYTGLVPEAEPYGNGNGDEPLTSEAAFSKAQTLSRGGDYRAAVRYLYLSSLLALDERGLLRYDRSRTNREYLRSVAGDAALAAPLKEVVDVFDNVWYGYHELDDESFRHYSGRVEELKEKKE